MTNTSNIAAAGGRLLLGLLFFVSGLGKVAAPAATQAMISKVGLPAPLLAYAGATAIEVIGGAMLIAGYRVKFAACVLTGFTMLAAIFFHTNFADQNQMIHFVKNFAITGGLLQVVAFGAGSLSLMPAVAVRRLRAARRTSPLDA